MKILKFGGSSLGTPARIKRVAGLIKERALEEPIAVVVSAIEGITNQLQEMAERASVGDKTYRALFLTME